MTYSVQVETLQPQCIRSVIKNFLPYGHRYPFFKNHHSANGWSELKAKQIWTGGIFIH